MSCCLLVETWHQARLSKYIVYYDRYSVELREKKVANLVWQAESGVVGAMKWAPQPFSYKCARPMSEVLHGQTLQNNNYQILIKLETNKNV